MEGWTPTTFDFEGATPYVSVVSVETDKYKSAAGSKQLEVGLNTITLELEPIGYVPPEGFDWTWIIVGIIVAAAFVAIVYLYRKGGRAKAMRSGSGKKRGSRLGRGSAGSKW